VRPDQGYVRVVALIASSAARGVSEGAGAMLTMLPDGKGGTSVNRMAKTFTGSVCPERACRMGETRGSILRAASSRASLDPTVKEANAITDASHDRCPLRVSCHLSSQPVLGYIRQV
jgi:hypothetical protein